MEGYTDLSRALRKFKAEDTTTITVYRSGRELTFDIAFDERPRDLNNDAAQQAPTDESQMPEDGDFNEWYDYFDRFFGFGK